MSMNRITKKEPNGTWNVLGIPWKEMDNRIYGALCKLKDYEDTGLSPEEVERLNTFDGSEAVQATAKLPAEQRKHRWIPVSEQLPEKEEVLCCNIDNIQMIGYLKRKRDTIVCEMHPLVMHDVVAWMALPEPYSQQLENQMAYSLKSQDGTIETNFDKCRKSLENMAQMIDIMKCGWTKEQIIVWLNKVEN